MARTYALLFGINYTVTALLEFLFREALFGFLHFTPLHCSIHAVTGVALFVARAKGERWSLVAARVVGPVFFTLFILGVAAPAFLSDVLGYPVNWLYNTVHLLTGAFGIYVGFLVKTAVPAPVSTAPPTVPPVAAA